MSKKTSTVDLSRLTQSQVAWLVGKPASWLRENAHRFERNPDGSYDGRTVFQNMAQTLGTVVIEDSKWQEILAYARDPRNCEECHAGFPCEFH